tara:strand:- start:421 stop:741 length:321 start_codon:yes stop_codon:yes gene_type:complete
MERYFYFGEATVATTGENAMYPLSSFLGMTPAGAATTTMHFKSRNGALTDDGVVVTHTGHTPKAFMTEVVDYLQRNQKNPFLIIKDGVSGAEVTSKIVSVAVTTAA